MIRTLAFIFIICFSYTATYGQADSLARKTKDVFTNIERQSEGRITFTQEDSIHNLVLKHIAKNKQKKGIPGYRIRIYSNLGTEARRESQEVRVKFYEEFPEIPVYREYDSPYFKVYVGDFRTKIEAIKSLKKISRYFPDAFVVPDQINYPDLD